VVHKPRHPGRFFEIKQFGTLNGAKRSFKRVIKIPAAERRGMDSGLPINMLLEEWDLDTALKVEREEERQNTLFVQHL
jgi:hypothetical protein